MKRLPPLLARMTRAAASALPAATLAGARRAQGRARAAVDVARVIDDALSAAGLTTGRAPASVAASNRRDRVVADVAPGAGRSADTAAGEARPAGTAPGTRARGEVHERHHRNAAGTRQYRLHVPAELDPERAAPLLLMLHGCSQDADAFAIGTRMDALADRHGVLVAWPTQPARDNGGRCWNWFRPEDQQRDGGEPSILAGIIAEVAGAHRVDARRVYVAGLSAGAAMAVILGRTYPDVFAAVGAHSGLPYAAARDVAGAFAAMQGRAAAPGAGVRAATGPVPTIVFHGDADRTVDAANGAAIVRDAVAGRPLRPQATDVDAGGRRCRVERFVDGDGCAIVEQWTLQGAGHLWSGGDPAGSHTDALGPDASAEMLRFFLSHARG